MSFNADILVARVKTVYRDLNKKSYSVLPDLAKSAESKSTNEAVELRNKGNTSFQKGLYEAALIFYTRSIASAEDNSEELALAHANRSAVLIMSNKYRPCLHDINRALKGKYPQHLKVKILDRKKRCLSEIRLENKRKARQSQYIPVKDDEFDPVDAPKYDEPTEWRQILKNPMLPNASFKIKLACDEKWGRYVVASRDIAPGKSSHLFVIKFLRNSC